MRPSNPADAVDPVVVDPVSIAETSVVSAYTLSAATQEAMYTRTPTPTLTPSPTYTPTISPVIIYPLPEFMRTLAPETVNENKSDVAYAELSFYDPHIGAYFPDLASVNCLQFDFGLPDGGDCISKVHRGMDDYRLWYRKGFACPEWMAIDTVIFVSSPVPIAGYWRCIDRGDLIVGHLFDFMLRYPADIWSGPDLDNFPWRSAVEYYIVSQ